MTKKTTLFDFLYCHAWLIQRCLRLTHFKVTFGDEFYNKDHKQQAGSASMTNIIDFKYLKSEIWVGPQIKSDWKEKHYKSIVDTLIHEICHIIIDEVYLCYENAVDKKKGKPDYTYGNFYREKAVSHITFWAIEMYEDFMAIENVDLKTGLIKKK